MAKDRIILFLVSLLNLILAQAQEVIPSRSGDSWGAVDFEKNVIIPYQYQKVSFYAGNYLLVEKNRKKGLFSKEGKQLLSANYDVIVPFTEHAFKVYIDGKVGVVGINNKEIIPIQFSTIVYNIKHNEYIVSYEGNFSLYNSEGEKLIPSGFENIAFYGDNSYLLKKDNKFAVTPSFKRGLKLEFYDNVVSYGDFYLVSDRNKYGLLNKSGNEIIKCNYQAIEIIGDRYIAVKKSEDYAFFDLRGKRISPYIFSKPFYYFENGVVWSKIDEKWNRYDLRNQEYTEFDIDRILDKQVGFLRVVENNYLVLYNAVEEKLHGNKFQDIIPLNDSVFKVQFDRKWGVIDEEGRLIVDVYYDQIDFVVRKDKKEIGERFENIYNKEDVLEYSPLLNVIKGGKRGVFDLTGKEIVPVDYSQLALSVWDRMIRTKYEGKYGVYSREGKKIYSNEYDYIDWNEKQAFFTMQKNDTLYIADSSNKIIDVSDLGEVTWSLKKNVFFAKKDSKSALFNTQLDTLINYKYEKLYDVGSNFFVGIVDNGTYVFSSKGELLNEQKFASVELIECKDQSFFIVKVNGKSGVMKSDGGMMIPAKYDKVIFDKRNLLFEIYDNKEFLGYYTMEGEGY